ncbi:hypothetical protein [Zobellia uliginosa]|nr:hypothetical protein [Zobellia uliginosa]
MKKEAGIKVVLKYSPSIRSIQTYNGKAEAPLVVFLCFDRINPLIYSELG